MHPNRRDGSLTATLEDLVANMTSFALSLNIELGVLLNGGDAPRQMERNLTELIRTGVLQEQLQE